MAAGNPIIELLMQLAPGFMPGQNPLPGTNQARPYEQPLQAAQHTPPTPSPPAPRPFGMQSLRQVAEDRGMGFQMSPGRSSGFLEFWPPGEGGHPDTPRPGGIAMDQPGVEVYDINTRPLDVLGDIVSHHSVEHDPKLRAYYEQFEQSLTPEQQQRLQDQYQHSRENFGEERSFEDWRRMSGLPGYFRGYAFQQWPDEFNQQAYTPEQIQMFDEMMQGLTAPQPAAVNPMGTTPGPQGGLGEFLQELFGAGSAQAGEVIQFPVSTRPQQVEGGAAAGTNRLITNPPRDIKPSVVKESAGPQGRRPTELDVRRTVKSSLEDW